MNMNRRAFIKKMNWSLAGCISMLGFVSCEKDNQGTVYTVKGTVVNKANGKPIKGIRVGFSPEYWPTYMCGVSPTPYQPKSHVLTDTKGEFVLADSFQTDEFQTVNNKPTLPVYVQDIDGEENGLFQDEYLQVDMSGGKTVIINAELTEIENKTDE